MNCYVADPKKGYKLPDGINKENTLFFPEASMTNFEKHTTARPAKMHIITDAPELVGLYDRDDVFVWKEGKWENPKIQTFGASLSIIRDDVFGIQHTIPAAVISNKLVTNCMGSPVKY